MSYRKIVVEGKTYEYVVGRSFTKVKGVGAVPNHQIGSDHLTDCGCGFGSGDCSNTRVVLRVTPANISEFIKKNA